MMKLITVSGAPSVGKTSVVLNTASALRKQGCKIGIAKFDCLSTEDDSRYRAAGFHVVTGLSGNVCPDHYYVSSIPTVVQWGEKQQLDFLFMESAGLCNRCSPHIEACAAVCVIDNLMGSKTPRKIGPILKKADFIVVTKGDLVSQAEREVFSFHIRQANPVASILKINGMTGQGCQELALALNQYTEKDSSEYRLRFTMPAAVCSYCVGERYVREEYSLDTLRELKEYD
jgi:Ni2+-binding GTPase involved in maturation of urease and hydrogenase